MNSDIWEDAKRRILGLLGLHEGELPPSGSVSEDLIPDHYLEVQLIQIYKNVNHKLTTAYNIYSQVGSPGT